jgi:S1-C subfamily serine protease
MILALDLPNAPDTDGLPTSAELERLTYQPADSNTRFRDPYAEVSDARQLFTAYAMEAQAVSRYHDPVLTRGVSGIQVFKTVSPAVVVVIVGSVKNQSFDPEGMGTGAIVDARGFILTNWHVIKGYSSAVVFLKPTNTSDLATSDAYVARVIYADPTVDLALLKMIDPPATLHPVIVGNLDQVQIAEDIHIIGHPHGNLWSYSTGVVSQIRDGYSWKYEDGSKHVARVLQLQTAINPGNSGGPVVDDTGRLLGLVAMSEEGQNLDYAIAADVIKNFLLIGMNMKTRGLAKPTSASEPPRQAFVSKLADESSVIKAVYSDVVLYGVQGKNAGLVAKYHDGTEIRAWDQSPSGEFKSWSAKLPQGKELSATASEGTMTRISMTH